MTNAPSLTQLLKHAIEMRLLDVHTALIGRVQTYYPDTQTADIEPVLKRTLKAIDGQIKQESLPLLIDVPIIFPSAGGFFVSFPVKPGDFVQIIFNEVNIDSEIDLSRFSLDGAVAIPGVYKNKLSKTHAENMVLGKDNSSQIHITDNQILLGSQNAKEALAIASKVTQELQKIITAFNTHTHSYHNTPTLRQILPSQNLGTKKVMAE